jgi:hypothetical protein
MFSMGRQFWDSTYSIWSSKKNRLRALQSDTELGASILLIRYKDEHYLNILHLQQSFVQNWT